MDKQQQWTLAKHDHTEGHEDEIVPGRRESVVEKAERIGALLGVDINLYKSGIPVSWQIEIVLPTGSKMYGLRDWGVGAEIGEIRAFLNGIEFCGLNAEVRF